jgi:hypothetical protein
MSKETLQIRGGNVGHAFLGLLPFVTSEDVKEATKLYSGESVTKYITDISDRDANKLGSFLLDNLSAHTLTKLKEYLNQDGLARQHEKAKYKNGTQVIITDIEYQYTTYENFITHYMPAGYHWTDKGHSVSHDWIYRVVCSGDHEEENHGTILYGIADKNNNFHIMSPKGLKLFIPPMA